MTGIFRVRAIRSIAWVCTLAMTVQTTPAGADEPASAPAEGDDVATDANDVATDANEEVIVVTGTRSERPLAGTPVITEVIDRKRLEESGVRTVSEALALRPGLWIDRGVAGTTGVTIQGLGPQYSLILVDGARQIGRTDGTLDLDRFGIADIEQIEIVRGPTSALYGADALGGVVNIITRKPGRGVTVDATARMDDRKAGELRGRVSGGLGVVAAALEAAYTDDPAIRRDPSTVATTIDAHEDRHVAARVSATHGEAWRFDGTADYLYRDLNGVDTQATGAIFDRRNLVETASARLAAQYATAATAIQLSADASLYRDQYALDQRRSDELDRYEVTDESLVEGAAQIARQLGDHRASLGGELLREGLDADRLARAGDRTRGAVFAQDEWRLGEVIVLPGARLDVDSQFGSHVTPRIAARWQVTGEVVARASAGLGYRAPSFKEMLLHFENPAVGYVVDGNPDLQPETSRSAQAGVEWQARPWLWLSVSGYHNGLHDLIYAVTKPDDGSGTLKFSYDNIGRARTSGVDVSAMATRGRLGVELGYALTRGYDLDAERPLESVPRHRATLAVRWRDRDLGLDAFAAATLTGHRPFYVSEDPQMATLSERRTELRARVAKRLGHLGGFVGVDNLLDAGDADLDRLAPRTFYAGLEAHL